MAKSKIPVLHPKHTTKKNVVAVSREEYEYEYQGPLPDPATFASYEQTTRGAGERILTMAEKEQKHRHEMERRMTEAYATDICQERREIGRAQWMAWTLAFGVITIGGFLVYAGHSFVGTLLTGGTLIGIVSTFLEKRFHQREDIKKPHHPAPIK